MLRPMVLRYLIRARITAQAMECRGLDPDRPRTMYRDVRMRAGDAGVIVLTVTGTVLVVGWALWGGLEAEALLAEWLMSLLS